MFGVRFLDPETGEIVYSGPLDTTEDAIITNPEASRRLTTSLTLNPVLGPAALPWDVRRSFRTHVKDWHQREVAKLAKPATFPPAVRLEIQSPQLPWRVEVRPSSPNLHVTVYDVLAVLHRSLKTEITKVEWERLNDTRKHSVLVARGLRAQEYEFDRTLDEFYRHPRRVDFLGECIQFAGLVPAPYRGWDSFDLEFVRRS